MMDTIINDQGDFDIVSLDERFATFSEDGEIFSASYKGGCRTCVFLSPDDGLVVMRAGETAETPSSDPNDQSQMIVFLAKADGLERLGRYFLQEASALRALEGEASS